MKWAIASNLRGEKGFSHAEMYLNLGSQKGD